MRRLILLCTLLSTFSYMISAQYRTLPPDIKWKQLNTDKYRIIYPEGHSAKARKIGGIIDYLYTRSDSSIGTLHKKIELYLVNTSAIPNGYVTLAPKHSMFYTTPFLKPLGGPIDWISLLSIHEYRHVKQINNIDHLLTRLTHYLLGETGWAILYNLTIPQWYTEGDATLQETLLSPGGRGRQPDFTAISRAMANGKKFRYDKVQLGSYKDMTPDSYELGYIMTSYARHRYGNDIWSKSLRTTTSFPIIYYPFSVFTYFYTGALTPEIYKHAYKELEDSTISYHNTPKSTLLTKSKRTPTLYSYPKWLNNSEWAYMKQSFKHPPGIFYRDKKGKEHKITSMGININEGFDAGGHTVLWESYSQDPRWTTRSYSDIYSYDLRHHTKKRITHKGHFYQPALSPDQKRIAAVELTPQGQNNIVILRLKDGKILRRLRDKEILPTYPTWIDKEHILCIERSNNQNQIVRWGIYTGKRTVVSPLTNYTISDLSTDGKYAYFHSNFEKSGNVFDYELHSGKLFRITDEPYNAEMPDVSPSGHQLLYVSYTQNHKNVYRLPIHPETWMPVEYTSYYALSPRMDSLKTADLGKEVVSALSVAKPAKNIKEKPFYPSSRFINIHSWIPIITQNELGLNVFSNDPLATLGTAASARYFQNTSNKFIQGEISLKYSGLYPVIGLNTGAIKVFLRDSNPSLDFNEQYIGTDLTLPLKYISGNYTTSITTSLAYNYRMRSIADFPVAIPEELYHTGKFSISFERSTFTARQNLGPSLGISADFQANKLLQVKGNWAFDSRVALFTRGLTPNHSLRLELKHHYQNIADTYRFIHRYLYVPGIDLGPSAVSEVLGFRASYQLPLWYPDFTIRGILDIQRLRVKGYYTADLFREFQLKGRPAINQSSGIELWMDNVGFRIVPVSIGIRYNAFRKSEYGNLKDLPLDLVLEAEF